MWAANEIFIYTYSAPPGRADTTMNNVEQLAEDGAGIFIQNQLIYVKCQCV